MAKRKGGGRVERRLRLGRIVLSNWMPVAMLAALAIALLLFGE